MAFLLAVKTVASQDFDVHVIMVTPPIAHLEVVSYLNSVLSTAVSQKSTHGLSTLQVCQTEDWVLF